MDGQIGPALPPHLRKKKEVDSDSVIGPVMPAWLKDRKNTEEANNEDPDLFGPSLPPGFENREISSEKEDR